MVSYLAVVWSFALQLIAPPPPCDVAAAPSVTAETVERADGRESEADDDAAAN